jgi:hypothetical protein
MPRTGERRAEASFARFGAMAASGAWTLMFAGPRRMAPFDPGNILAASTRRRWREPEAWQPVRGRPGSSARRRSRPVGARGVRVTSLGGLSEPAPTRCRTPNRPARNAAPRACGSPTAWFGPGVNRQAGASSQAGRRQPFADAAILARPTIEGRGRPENGPVEPVRDVPTRGPASGGSGAFDAGARQPRRAEPSVTGSRRDRLPGGRVPRWRRSPGPKTA